MSSRDRAQKSIQSPVAVPANIITPCELSRATQTDGPAEDLQMGERLEPQDQATVDKLPDEVLLDIFSVYSNDDERYRIQNINEWHTLVHVCRRWRDLVFTSPRRLNLRLLCRRYTRVRAMLNIWPALPIEIYDPWVRRWKEGLDNVIAALEHPGRVRSIVLRPFSRSLWEALVVEMQVPFPELTCLRLWSDGGPTLALPDSFLGGSAPRLRTLKLGNISFPAASNLLFSASNLVDLSLSNIPHSGYISPEAMVACLSLDRLESLQLGFEEDPRQPCSDRSSPPPQTRAVFPALTELTFQGTTHYLDDFVARIDTPVLNKFSMSFFLDPVFDVPHLKQFIGRAKGLEPYKVARVAFTTESIELELIGPLPLSLEMTFDCTIDWKVNAMSRVCGQLSPFLCPVERLDIVGRFDCDPQEDELEFSQIFQPFTAIRSLHVSESIVPLVAPALQEFIDEGASDVLPNLRDLFLGGPAIPGTVPEAMQSFVDARRLSGQPIAMRHWEGPGADL